MTVTALMPGPTDTEFFDRAGMQGTKLREQTAKDDPAEVAREGFEALMAGKDHVIAGSAKNKVQAAAGRVMPETKKAALRRARRSQAAAPSSSDETTGTVGQRSEVMKALVWHGTKDVRVEEVPDPKIEQPTDAIVGSPRPRSVGRTCICTRCSGRS